MQTYRAPLRDMRFVLHELHGSAELADALGFEEATPDTLDAVLDASARIAEEVLLPLNAPGDQEGCAHASGTVRTPQGFPQAYAAYREGGWMSLSAAAENGGQGMPESLAKLCEEMVASANMAFGLYPGLTRSAAFAIAAHATPELKARFLPQLVAGTWCGTMCLTEAHCGTDLGLLRARASPRADGSFALDGTKIFVSSGEHDLAENIVHLVLARLPDAPAGTRGISLFLVPKFVPAGGGLPATRNGVACLRLEDKMGIKASATCQMQFSDARGWMVGAPNRGLAAMFTMINRARLAVGVQGLGVAEAAYQSAVAYARDRLQGGSADGTATPIIAHPDVRLTLMRMRAETEGCRALAGWVARALDRAKRSKDPVARREAEDFCHVMTPVVKALFTDLGFANASRALQVHGGHGYIRDNGIEQYARDARVCMVYEGTNGIQALDLVARKLPAHGGRYLRTFFHPVGAFLERHGDDPKVAALRASFADLQRATLHVARADDGEEAAAAASDYLRLFGLVALGFLWARAALVASEAQARGAGDDAFYAAKQVTARFYFDRILPETGSLLRAIQAGKSSAMALDVASF